MHIGRAGLWSIYLFSQAWVSKLKGVLWAFLFPTETYWLTQNLHLESLGYLNFFALLCLWVLAHPVDPCRSMSIHDPCPARRQWYCGSFWQFAPESCDAALFETTLSHQLWISRRKADQDPTRVGRGGPLYLHDRAGRAGWAEQWAECLADSFAPERFKRLNRLQLERHLR